MNKLYKVTATVEFIINTNEKEVIDDINNLTPLNKNIIDLEVLDFETMVEEWK